MPKDDKIINPSKLNIYGINAFINRFNNTKGEIFDLDTLKETFEINYTFDDTTQQIEETMIPAFVSKELNKRITLGDVAYSESYNYPPIGPLPNFCVCTYCKNHSPNYHSIECPYPENKSLFLTLEGLYKYIVISPTYNGEYSKFRDLWNLTDIDEPDKSLNTLITQDDLNSILLEPNSVKVNSKETSEQFLKIPTLYALTNIRYLDIVKLRGPTKLEYTTATQKFNNALMVGYEYLDDSPDGDKISKKTSIRIYKNGLINLVNVPKESIQRKKLYSEIKKRIDVEGFNIDEFNEQLEKEQLKSDYDSFEIIDELSYTHSINCQFNLWTIKEQYNLNFDNLNNLISPINSKGLINPSSYTKIELIDDSKQVIILTSPSDNSKKIKIVNWEYIKDKETRLNQKAREEIKCIIIPRKGVKISLQIHRHGTFQMSMSYCNTSDLKNKICDSINKNANLNYSYFKLIQDIFAEIINLKSDTLISPSLEYIPDEIKNSMNTISGKAPPKQPGSSTEVCRSRDPRPGYPGLRPIPYSFKGQCPEAKQYINPQGVLGNDGLYYPCCATKTYKAEQQYKQMLIDGFPKDKEKAEELGIIGDIDTKSGILVPGSYHIGSKTKALINDDWKNVEIISYQGKSAKPQVFIVKDTTTGIQYTVKRENLLRDTRYFPGLKTFSKEQLIKCIMRHLSDLESNDIINNYENLKEIKSKIDLPDVNFNPILTYTNINIFTKLPFSVTSIPSNTQFYYLYIDKDKSYYINLNGNIIEKSLTATIKDTLIFSGFLELETNNYYIIDILYRNQKLADNMNLNEKIKQINELSEMYFTTDNLINICEYKQNITKSSRDLIVEESEINLVFMPEQYTKSNFKIWINPENISMKKEIVLQIVNKIKGNYYALGFENNIIVPSKYDLSLQFNNIKIKKAFIDNNDIKIGDYVLFKFDYNIQTQNFAVDYLIPQTKVDKPKLTFEQTIIKLSMIIDPINVSFFLNNQIEEDSSIEYIFIIPHTEQYLKLNNKTLLLEKI